MELIITPFDTADPVVATKAESLVRAGYTADVWLLCNEVLGTADPGDDEYVVQLRNEDGDNWLIDEKGIGHAVLAQDCIHITAEHETDAAILVDQYRVGDAWSPFREEVWLPRSQVTTFERKES